MLKIRPVVDLQNRVPQAQKRALLMEPGKGTGGCGPAPRWPRETRRPRRRSRPPCARSAGPLPDAGLGRSAPEGLPGMLCQQSCRVPHHLFEGFRSPRQLPFREGQVLDGICEIVHSSLQPFPVRRPAPAVPVGVQVVRGIAEGRPLDGVQVACLKTSRQDHGQHALDILARTVQARAQPRACVLLDRCAGANSVSTITGWRSGASIRMSGLLPGSRARHSLLDHVGPLSVDSAVGPVGIATSQRASQRSVR